MYAFFGFCFCNMIEILIMQTLWHRNNFIYLLFCQSLPYSFDPNTANEHASEHSKITDSVQLTPLSGVNYWWRERKAAKLAFMYLNIEFKSPNPLCQRKDMILSAKQPKHLPIPS